MLRRRNPTGYFGWFLVPPPLPAVPLAACRCRWAAARGWWGRQDGAGLSGAGGVQGAAEAPCLLPFPPSHPSEPKEPQSHPQSPRARGERRVARVAKVLALGGVSGYKTLKILKGPFSRDNYFPFFAAAKLPGSCSPGARTQPWHGHRGKELPGRGKPRGAWGLCPPPSAQLRAAGDREGDTAEHSAVPLSRSQHTAGWHQAGAGHGGTGARGLAPQHPPCRAPSQLQGETCATVPAPAAKK